MPGFADRHPAPTGSEGPEAAFLFDGVPTLRPANARAGHLAYLARRVASHPGDLVSHARRVILAQTLGDTEETFAGLVDLFVATGARGHAIRRRLLAAGSAVLTPLQRQFLEKHLVEGLQADSPVTSDFTVLTSGIEGCRAFSSKERG